MRFEERKVQIRPGNGAVVLTAGLAAAVLLGPFVLRGDPAENARLDANRRQIAEMTEASRQKLLRNFERWQSLSATEQKQWREFAQQLEVNRASLGPVVADYYGWLETIPGYRRDELRQAADVQQKVSLVKEIIQEQLAARADVQDEETFRVGGRLEAVALSSSELDVVFSALEEGLQPSERASLADREGNELSGVERHLMVLAKLIRFGGLRQAVENPSQRQRLQAAIPARVAAVMEQVRDRSPRGLPIAMVLAVSVRLELDRAFRASQPSPGDLRMFYDQRVDQNEQEQLLNLSGQDFHDELRRRYYRAQLEERIAIDLPAVQRFLGSADGRRGDPSFEGRPDPQFPPLPGSGGRPLPREERRGSDGDRPDGSFRRPPGDEGKPGRPIDGERPPREEARRAVGDVPRS